MIPTKENTLYLPIKQVYFDQIIAGAKKEEYRVVGYGITANRYLQKDGREYKLNPSCTREGEEYFIDDYNDGKFPFLPKPYKYLYIAVGYAKERDTALVEVIGITFEPTRVRGEGEKKFTWWQVVYHLGKVVELHRKDE